MSSQAASDLGRKARRGALWSILGFGGSRIFAIISSPILSYVLLPETRGLMEWVTPFILGFELLSDLGIGPSIVQNPRGDEPSFVDTAFTIQASRGLLLWLAVCVGAFPYARLAGQPELLYIVPIAGLSALFAGLTSTKVYTASRHVALGPLTGLEIGSQLVAFVVKLTWAWLSPTVWSLVVGGLSGLATKMILSHVLLPGHRNRFQWDPIVAKALVHFGRWVFVSTLLTFLTSFADRWIFGALIPLSMLGLYGNAATLAALPMDALSHLAHQVIFPLYSRVLDAGVDLNATFRRARLPILIAGGWALSGLIAGGPTAMRLLYDREWWGSGWMIQILAISAWFGVCEATNGAAILAHGKPRWLAVASFAKLIGMCTCIPIGWRLAGFPGALAAYALTELFRYGVSLLAAYRIGLAPQAQDLGITAMVLGVGALTWRVAIWMEHAGVSVLVEAIAIAVMVTIAWAPLARKPIADFLRERRLEPAPAGMPASAE